MPLGQNGLKMNNVIWKMIYGKSSQLRTLSNIPNHLKRRGSRPRSGRISREWARRARGGKPSTARGGGTSD
jgi:hypothetical protein